MALLWLICEAGLPDARMRIGDQDARFSEGAPEGCIKVYLQS
jgi:hypothetical protein